MRDLDGGAMKMVTAEDLARLAPHGEVVEALRDAFAQRYVTPLRHHHDIDRGASGNATYLLMPAWTEMSGSDEATRLCRPQDGPGGARQPARGLPTVQATYQLFSGLTGATLALLDGTELTLRRTACASALGASYLARAQSARMVIVGAGALAPHMVRAHAAVRPIRHVAVWSRTRANAEDLAAAFARRASKTEAPDDLESAVGRADIVSCATTSAEPVVLGNG
jgi:ornithine cyclodeaminase/alanine dehydrogenase-like protein (mu-crystallin family)